MTVKQSFQSGQTYDSLDCLCLPHIGSAEISLNELPAGANVPFVHSHKENEEIYGILSGNGKTIIDGEEISLSTGDWLKIAPAAKRQFFASDISGITYICIQVKENSLEHFSAEDGVIG